MILAQARRAVRFAGRMWRAFAARADRIRGALGPDRHEEFHAQHGEDRFVWRYFRRKSSGFFVEIGAFDGIQYSNTCFLERKGWRGICVEPIPDRAREAAANRPGSRVVQCALGGPGSRGTIDLHYAPGWTEMLSFVGDPGQDHRDRIDREGGSLETLSVPFREGDSLLEEYLCPPGFELLSIDVEGGEESVLQGLSLSRWRPRLVIVEANQEEARSGTDRLLREHAYSEIKRLGCNAVYERQRQESPFRRL